MDKQSSIILFLSRLIKRSFVLLQYYLPAHGLSRLIYHLTRSEIPLLKNSLIKLAVKRYQIELDQAVIPDIAGYGSFNAFFTRALSPEARPIAAAQIVSPVDGVISQYGVVTAGQAIQAKGHHYSLLSLLGGDDGLAQQFEGGQFMTLYLSPKDYHRIHMPLAGTLKKMRYVPGQLFSVNATTVDSVPDLFARNERVIITFDTVVGPMVMVLVGAIFVGSIDTVWMKQVGPRQRKVITQWEYHQQDALKFTKGEEVGRFNMGSTVILLTGQQASQFLDRSTEYSRVEYGQALTEQTDSMSQ